MYQVVYDFFAFFFADSIDISVLSALFVGFVIMLVYGIMIRPFLNIVGGER